MAKGQVVLPAELRRRLGLNPGARLDIPEQPDGLRLRVQRRVADVDLGALAGTVRAPSQGRPRKLEDFDGADEQCFESGAGGAERCVDLPQACWRR